MTVGTLIAASRAAGSQLSEQKIVFSRRRVPPDVGLLNKIIPRRLSDEGFGKCRPTERFYGRQRPVDGPDIEVLPFGQKQI